MRGPTETQPKNRLSGLPFHLLQSRPGMGRTRPADRVAEAAGAPATSHQRLGVASPRDCGAGNNGSTAILSAGAHGPTATGAAAATFAVAAAPAFQSGQRAAPTALQHCLASSKTCLMPNLPIHHATILFSHRAGSTSLDVLKRQVLGKRAGDAPSLPSPHFGSLGPGSPRGSASRSASSTSRGATIRGDGTTKTERAASSAAARLELRRSAHKKFAS